MQTALDACGGASGFPLTVAAGQLFIGALYPIARHAPAKGSMCPGEAGKCLRSLVNARMLKKWPALNFLEILRRFLICTTSQFFLELFDSKKNKWGACVYAPWVSVRFCRPPPLGLAASPDFGPAQGSRMPLPRDCLLAQRASPFLLVQANFFSKKIAKDGVFEGFQGLSDAGGLQ